MVRTALVRAQAQPSTWQLPWPFRPEQADRRVAGVVGEQVAVVVAAQQAQQQGEAAPATVVAPGAAARQEAAAPLRSVRSARWAAMMTTMMTWCMTMTRMTRIMPAPARRLGELGPPSHPARARPRGGAWTLRCSASRRLARPKTYALIHLLSYGILHPAMNTFICILLGLSRTSLGANGPSHKATNCLRYPLYLVVN